MLRTIKTYSLAQTFGFFDVELRSIGLTAQRRGDWFDQPDLQLGPLRTDCGVDAAATNRRLKNED